MISSDAVLAIERGRHWNGEFLRKRDKFARSARGTYTAAGDDDWSRGLLKKDKSRCDRGLFGRWQWPNSAPVHPREAGRFAIHADGRRESATESLAARAQS